MKRVSPWFNATCSGSWLSADGEYSKYYTARWLIDDIEAIVWIQETGNDTGCSFSLPHVISIEDAKNTFELGCKIEIWVHELDSQVKSQVEKNF